jgi:hypothetical protein
VDQGGKVRPQLDAAFLPQVRRQPTRLWLFILAYNLGNFVRNLALPGSVKCWSLHSVQTRLIKTGGWLVRHARWLRFQPAEVLVTREMMTGLLERISRLRLPPG